MGVGFGVYIVGVLILGGGMRVVLNGFGRGEIGFIVLGICWIVYGLMDMVGLLGLGKKVKWIRG